MGPSPSVSQASLLGLFSEEWNPHWPHTRQVLIGYAILSATEQISFRYNFPDSNLCDWENEHIVNRKID